MKVTPLSSPLPGEHLIATWPRMRPFTSDDRPESDPGWRLRLRYWAGRALTREALELEQSHRASHLAWRGRTATPGIIRGLEIGLESPETPAEELTPAGHFIHVLPGYGITASGEDVLVPRALRVALDQIPIEGGDGAAIPWAAVLVLDPAEFRAFDNQDPTDPCELDPSRDAFADERRQDAAMLNLVALPEAWASSPDLGDRDDLRWRNRLAHFVLLRAAAESKRQHLRYLESRPAGERWDVVLRTADPAGLPWVQAGLPLAVLSSEVVPGSTQRRFFLDRGSVVRSGGQAPARSRPTIRLATAVDESAIDPDGVGDASVWRARIDQFAEHMSAFAPDESITDQSQYFQYLPPAGLLPKSALEMLTTSEALLLGATDRAAVSRFFPPAVSVEATPTPIEDLDAVLAASAPLAPFDLASDTPEYVRMLVPLPQNLYDPDVLVLAEEDPIFTREVGRLVAERQDWRQRRDAVRARRDTLGASIDGPDEDAAPPSADRGRLEAEPVESTGALGFDEAIVSPSARRGPWEVTVSFDEPQEVDPDSVLFVRIRTDEDRPPGPIEISWRDERGTATLDHRWDAPPDYPLEQLDENGEPMATPLWRRFTVDADDVELEEGLLAGFTLTFERGRIAVSGAGRLRLAEDGSTQEEVWWRVQDPAEAPSIQFGGGEWTGISGDRLLAPFEEDYEPVFTDGLTLDERLDELPSVQVDADATDVRDVGLVRYLEALNDDINRADDKVDLGFLKAQSNIHRIRKVMLGEEAADKLLISPSISSMVKLESARATEEQLIAALKTAKASQQAVSESDEEAEPDDSTGGGGEAPSPLFAAAFIPREGFSIGTTFESRTVSEAGPLRFFEPRTDVELAALGATFQPQPVRSDVLQAQPIIGQTFDVRTLSIAKRFDGGPVLNAYDYAHAGFQEALSAVIELNLGFTEGEHIPDVTIDDGEPVTYSALAAGGIDMLGQLEYVEEVLPEERTGVDSTQSDTGRILSKGIRRADATVLIYRRFEYYIARRREQLRRADEVLAELRRNVKLAADRLLTIEGKLAEERHDVAVARALRAEEQDRIQGINERRDALIRDEVTFLAFVRPRTVDLGRRVLPAWRFEHEDAPAPVPACLRQHDEPPDPLRAYVQLFRHAPARWFVYVEPHLKTLNTQEKLVELLRTAQQSSARFVAGASLPFVRKDLAAAPRAALQTGFSIVETYRRRTAASTIAVNGRASWSDEFRRAAEHASLGDVVDGRHGASGLARRAADELDQVERIATCLHAEFAALPPAVRLAWVERYSQFDKPSPLRRLTVLPKFETLPRDVRRRLQEFSDWLFGRIDQKEKDAFGMMNDLIRICLLLASHAPVRKIIAGHVPRPVSVRPGVVIPLRPLETLQVKVGMQFQIWRGSTVVARGNVEDLDGEEVSARVEHVEAATSTIEPSMSVQFVPEAFSMFSR